jgi:hypothetical protein
MEKQKMTEKRKLKVDWFELSAAFELNIPETEAYLDLETGAVLNVTDEARRQLESLWDEIPAEAQDPRAALEDRLAQHSELHDWQRQTIRDAMQVEFNLDRYLSIDPEPYADYNDMERFIWTLDDDQLAVQLDRAIRGRGAFRRFKDLLARHPQIQAAWYDFKDRQNKRRMRDWLEFHNIEPLNEIDDESLQ